MPGKKQPTDVIVASGRKHLSTAEEDARRDMEVHVPPPDKAVPPKWLPKKLHREFCEIGEILRAAGMYSELDRDVLGQYFLARERWIAADKEAAKAIKSAKSCKGDDGADAADAAKAARDWAGIQSTYFRQARQCAEVMGLSVSSRCWIVVPTAVVNAAAAAPDDGEDEFTKLLSERQRRAGENERSAARGG